MIDSIDREFKALKEQAARSQFVYSSSRAKLPLRPYQEQAITNLAHLYSLGTPSVGVQLPTGAGKTFVIHSFIQTVLPGKNVLVVTPSWEIAHQHAATICQRFRKGKDSITRLGGQGQLMSLFPEHTARSKGKTILTTSSLFFARQTQLRAEMKVDLVVIDEGHYGWKKKRLNAIQAFAAEQKVPCILLTATPPQNMEQIPFAAQLSYLDLVPEFLVPCEVVRLETGHEFKPKMTNGVLSQRSRAEISSRASRFEKILNDSMPLWRGQTIYYAGSVLEATGVLDRLQARGVEAVVVHSQWPSKGDKINALAIERFRRGEAKVLVNVQMLAMGFDVPNVETIVVARPVESDTLFTQMVGRGARPAPGKEKFILIDVHDTILKPDVAKIFEHKHLFYSGTDKDIKGVLRRSAAPVVRIVPLDLRGFPYHEGQLDDRTLVIDSPAEIARPQPFLEIAQAAWATPTRR